MRSIGYAAALALLATIPCTPALAQQPHGIIPGTSLVVHPPIDPCEPIAADIGGETAVITAGTNPPGLSQVRFKLQVQIVKAQAELPLVNPKMAATIAALRALVSNFEQSTTRIDAFLMRKTKAPPGEPALVAQLKAQYASDPVCVQKESFH